MQRPWIFVLVLAVSFLSLAIPACNSSETKIPFIGDDDDDDDDNDDSFTPSCTQDEDCNEGQVCDQGNCVTGDDDDDDNTDDDDDNDDAPACVSDEDCQGGQVCVDGVCAKLCRNDDDCQAPTPFCHPDLYCVQCLFDEDCPDEQHCDNQVCVGETDGDTPDGDVEIPDSCEGVCDAGTLPAFCMGDNACVCQAAGWTLMNCQAVCDFEQKPLIGCGEREGYNGPYCLCGDAEDGDVTDGDVTDGDVSCEANCNTDQGEYCNPQNGQCENVSCVPCDKDDDCNGGTCGDVMATGDVLERVCLGSCGDDGDCGLGYHCEDDACRLNSDVRCPRFTYAGFTENCQSPGNLDAPQCARGLRCVYVPDTQISWCSSPCSGDEDCSGWENSCCGDLSDGQRYCFAPDYCRPY